jgi:hypothetical protein
VNPKIARRLSAAGGAAAQATQETGETPPLPEVGKTRSSRTHMKTFAATSSRNSHRMRESSDGVKILCQILTERQDVEKNGDTGEKPARLKP